MHKEFIAFLLLLLPQPWVASVNSLVRGHMNIYKHACIQDSLLVWGFVFFLRKKWNCTKSVTFLI